MGNTLLIVKPGGYRDMFSFLLSSIDCGYLTEAVLTCIAQKYSPDVDLEKFMHNKIKRR